VWPLAEAVIENTRAAALRDPRFNPVEPDEVDRLEIELSVLTPLHAVENVDEIEVGRDGVLIDDEGRRGVVVIRRDAQDGGHGADRTLGPGTTTGTMRS